MKWLLPALAALVFSGCISFNNGYQDIKIGMSGAEVKGAMRSCPNTSAEIGRYKSMTYLNRMQDFFQWAPANYTFIFRDDALVEFGEGVAVAKAVTGEEGLKLQSPDATTGVVAEKAPPAVCAS